MQTHQRSEGYAGQRASTSSHFPSARSPTCTSRIETAQIAPATVINAHGICRVLEMYPSEFYQEVHFNGERYIVDACGFYRRLMKIPLDQLEPTEKWPKSPILITRYAKMYQAGSPFPPIDVCGTTPDHPKYSISNGHHRYLAAQRVRCPTLLAWVCFYVNKGRPGQPFWALARMSDTTEGRALARYIGWQWCPRCGRFLNYAGGAMCKSCQLDMQLRERKKA